MDNSEIMEDDIIEIPTSEETTDGDFAIDEVPDDFPEDVEDEKEDQYIEYKDGNIDYIQEDIENDGRELQSEYTERFQQTPKDPERWVEGLEMRGECMCISDDEEVKQFLEAAGVEGIEYKNCIPDFSPVSKGNVEIADMSEDRLGSTGNFKQADMLLAEQKGCEWREVAEWRSENHYTWHECNDRKTCQKVPICINSKFGHLGGVAECKRAIEKDVAWEGEFDDI